MRADVFRPHRSRLLACALFLAGCAAHSPPGTFQQRLAAQPTLLDLREKTLRVLQRLQYEVDRTETEPQFFVETHWLGRTLWEAERELGAEEARTRIRVTGILRARTAITQTYTVTFEMENQIRLPDQGWVTAPGSAEFRSLAARLASDLDAELDQGIRRVGMEPGG